MPANEKHRPIGSRSTPAPEGVRRMGWREVRLLVPDTSSPDFVAEARRQARAIAEADPAAEELDAFLEATRDWPA